MMRTNRAMIEGLNRNDGIWLPIINKDGGSQQDPGGGEENNRSKIVQEQVRGIGEDSGYSSNVKWEEKKHPRDKDGRFSSSREAYELSEKILHFARDKQVTDDTLELAEQAQFHAEKAYQTEDMDDVHKEAATLHREGAAQHHQEEEYAETAKDSLVHHELANLHKKALQAHKRATEEILQGGIEENEPLYHESITLHNETLDTLAKLGEKYAAEYQALEDSKQVWTHNGNNLSKKPSNTSVLLNRSQKSLEDHYEVANLLGTIAEEIGDKDTHNKLSKLSEAHRGMASKYSIQFERRAKRVNHEEIDWRPPEMTSEDYYTNSASTTWSLIDNEERNEKSRDDSFFSRCKRDKKGHCLPGEKGGGGSKETPKPESTLDNKGLISKIEDHLGKGFSRLPKPVQKALKVAYRTAFVTYIAGQALAERVARERGLSEEKIQKLRATLVAADLAVVKGTVPLGAALGVGSIAYFTPGASAAYIMYSTARNPLATLRAAHGVVKDTLDKMDKVVEKMATKPTQTDAKPELVSLDRNERSRDYKLWVPIINTDHPHTAAERSSFFSRCRRDQGGHCLPEGFSGPSDQHRLSSRGPTTAITIEKELLRTLKVVSMRHLEGGANVSKVIRLYDGTKAVFKPEDGEDHSLRWSIPDKYYAREAAASDLASHLGMDDLVPPTVVREVRGVLGSVQKFVKGSVPVHMVDEHDRYDGVGDLARAAAFDYLISNQDRHEGNWMVNSTTGRITLIDHGLCFPNKYRNEVAEDCRMIYQKAKSLALPIPQEIKNLSDQTLESIIRDRGLGDAEVLAARQRLADLRGSNDFEELERKYLQRVRRVSGATGARPGITHPRRGGPRAD